MSTSDIEPRVVVSFVNVGFGDCTTIVQRSSQRAMVIDCPPWGIEAALSTLEDIAIDTVFVTHLDLDHYGGIAELLERAGGCREIRMAPVVSLNAQGRIKIRAFVREIARFLRDLTTGLVVTADDSGVLGDVRWLCLSPGLVQHMEALVSTNNRASVVLMVQLGDLRILIGSDADGVVWRDLIDKLANDLRADIFRYPHHGAELLPGQGKASLDELLGFVRPSYVVLSIGERARYNHPSLSVIASLRTAGCNVMCTRSTALCNGGKPSDRGCAGDVSVTWSLDEWTVAPDIASHALVIDSLSSPACRESEGQKQSTRMTEIPSSTSSTSQQAV